MNTLGKMLTGAAVLAATNCGPAYHQPDVVYARPDYGVGWDKEVALFNIQEILKNIASERSGTTAYATTDGLYKKDNFCPPGYISGSTCLTNSASKVTIDLKWDEIKQKQIQVVEDGLCLYFGNDKYGHEQLKKDRLCANNSEQAAQLVQAIKIYLRERNK
ncbi:MAG: hypothetical protein AABY26_00250 [Nanoarchaeota archaeon]